MEATIASEAAIRDNEEQISLEQNTSNFENLCVPQVMRASPLVRTKLAYYHPLMLVGRFVSDADEARVKDFADLR